MINKKVTGKEAATNASTTMRDKTTSKNSKTANASALAQRKAPEKQTSSNAAAKASNVMSDGRTSKTSKSGAASALSQAARKAIKKT